LYLIAVKVNCSDCLWEAEKQKKAYLDCRVKRSKIQPLVSCFSREFSQYLSMFFYQADAFFLFKKTLLN
jgi:hypothetical protein